MDGEILAGADDAFADRAVGHLGGPSDRFAAVGFGPGGFEIPGAQQQGLADHVGLNRLQAPAFVPERRVQRSMDLGGVGGALVVKFALFTLNGRQRRLAVKALA